MSYFAICGIIGFLTGVPCALFVFFNKPRTPTKVLSSFYSLVMSIWGIGTFRFFTTTDHDTALFCDRVLNLVVAFIPLFFFHFVVLLTNTWLERKRAVINYYVIFGIYFFASMIWPHYATEDVTPRPGFNFYPVSGPIFTYFTFFFLYAYIHGGVVLYKAYQKASIIRRNQYKYFAIATVLMVLGALTSFFLEFDIPIFPFGVAMVPLYHLLTAYIIIKHHLMDIRVIIRKSLIYTILGGVITIFYLAAVFLTGKAFHNVLGYESSMGSAAVMVLIAILFIPMKNHVQSFVDKYFFKASYMQMAEQNDLLSQQVIRSERYKTMSALSRRIMDELRDPLTALVGYSYLLPKKLQDQEFLNKFSLVYSKELKRMQDLLTQLTEFSEPKDLDLQPTDITEILNELSDYLSKNLQEKEIKLFKYYDSQRKILLKLDHDQIKRALYLFLANSVKSTARNGQIWIGMEETETGLAINIKDTGSGLSQDTLLKIFDPLFSSQKEESPYSGFAIAQSIITNHGGKVLVDSQIDVGTEWIIQLLKIS